MFILLLLIAIVAALVFYGRKRRHTEPYENPEYILGTPYQSIVCDPTDPKGKIHDLPPVRYDIDYPSTLPRSNAVFVRPDPNVVFQRLL